MITKKKLKTKFDYEVRTFGVCALLLLAFSVFVIKPSIDYVKNDNSNLNEEIRKEEDLNNRLKFEHGEIISDSTIKND